MEIFALSIAVVCSLSVGLNILLIIKRRLDRRKPQPTIEAQDLLHDLISSHQAVIKITVVDPEGLMIWRGRH